MSFELKAWKRTGYHPCVLYHHRGGKIEYISQWGTIAKVTKEKFFAEYTLEWTIAMSFKCREKDEEHG